jgi:MFS transporter, putative metabolite:H+ symporter
MTHVSHVAAQSDGPTLLTPYQKQLFFFLSVATFFEGYDLFALAQILPNLQADMDLAPADAGILVAVANLGNVLAYALVRMADRWGRRRVLTITIAGYTLLSLLTAFSFNVWMFAFFQLCARIFLASEYAVSMVYAAEEYPADRRGMVIGVIQACASLGAIACAGVVPLLLQTAIGWRSVFLVGTVPLALIAIARRSLRETARFAHQAEVGMAHTASFTRVLRTPYRKRVFQLASLWALTYIGTLNAIAFWKGFAMAERGMSDAQVGASLTVAAVAAMPMVFLAGKLLDLIGRRLGAAVIFTVTALGVLGSYTLSIPIALIVALVLGIFGASGVLPVLTAFTAELFPTELRSEAYAWANNLLGRLGYLVSPLLVGLAADTFGWGPAVATTAIFPLLALGVIWAVMPETIGRELEETSAIRGNAVPPSDGKRTFLSGASQGWSCWR